MVHPWNSDICMLNHYLFSTLLERFDLFLYSRFVCLSITFSQVILTLLQEIPGLSIPDLFVATLNEVKVHVVHDGLLPRGSVTIPGHSGNSLHAYNAGGHEITWGVLGAAVEALQDWSQNNAYGQMTYAIYDGPNQVGEGWIG